MKASELMTRDPRSVTPTTSLRDAARLMKDENVGILPVVESAGSKKLVGVITDRDIAIRHVAAGHTGDCVVQEAMSTDLTTCREDDDVDRVLEAMGGEQIRRIPIVDERGALVGIVAQADVARKASDKKAERTIEKISAPSERHAQ